MKEYINIVSKIDELGREIIIGADWDYEKLGRLYPDTQLTRNVRDLIAQFIRSPDIALDRRLRAVPYRLETTPFRARVLERIAQIPYGETQSYKDIAWLLGTSPRAVGQAVKRNPLAILIPCHRVINHDGSLGGYFGTRGLEIKRALLDGERA